MKQTLFVTAAKSNNDNYTSQHVLLLLSACSAPSDLPCAPGVTSHCALNQVRAPSAFLRWGCVSQKCMPTFWWTALINFLLWCVNLIGWPGAVMNFDGVLVICLDLMCPSGVLYIPSGQLVSWWSMWKNPVTMSVWSLVSNHNYVVPRTFCQELVLFYGN